MAVTFDAATASATTGSTGDNMTMTHTVSAGSNLLLVVGVGIRTTANTQLVSTLTANGQALTLATRAWAPAGAQNAELWYLANPDVGSNSIVVQLNTSKRFVVAAASYSGVDQTTPMGAENADSADTATDLDAYLVAASPDKVVGVMGKQYSNADRPYTITGDQNDRAFAQDTSGSGNTNTGTTLGDASDGTNGIAFTYSAAVAAAVVAAVINAAAVTTVSGGAPGAMYPRMQYHRHQSWTIPRYG